MLECQMKATKKNTDETCRLCVRTESFFFATEPPPSYDAGRECGDGETGGMLLSRQEGLTKRKV